MKVANVFTVLHGVVSLLTLMICIAALRSLRADSSRVAPWMLGAILGLCGRIARISWSR
jgi:hypothetical protein